MTIYGLGKICIAIILVMMGCFFLIAAGRYVLQEFYALYAETERWLNKGAAIIFAVIAVDIVVLLAMMIWRFIL